MNLYLLLTAIVLAIAGLSGRSGALQATPTSPVAKYSPKVDEHSETAKYVGDAACESCHAAQAGTYDRTAHYLTSRLPSAASILGKFTAGANVMKTSNPDLFFRMEQKGDEFFQTAVEGENPFITERSERFAFVVGSGGKGQTYLFWKADELFELPVSYWDELGWVNSPGYRDGVANFGRPVIPRCLECHATYFDSLAPPPNRYRKSGFVLGITCEKCHGPGRDHAARAAEKSITSASSGILNPKNFPRARQMDLCAWCHAGAGISLRPEFSYIPGEPLEKNLRLPEPDAAAPIDVHGSQVEMLERSRCFQQSGMTCLTCHDVHVVQHDTGVFSNKCLGCHKPGTEMFPQRNHKASSDCIDCHMPVEDTNLIVFDQNGRRARPKVRSHWIKVYGASDPPAAASR